ncbi:hypothetical protein CALVIDRAFT_531987 [Calocera viscosa TUFC12733]|uniref:Uncharacterized protein n=1 Tax=Calocera viscosa (strain TUFC12733) TaxID=1330018 RepID=A0A167FKM9_CALVF|nr:hypothetical protein CALVIDRAFT_531987 [Calocera viscosa TUFC12733]
MIIGTVHYRQNDDEQFRSHWALFVAPPDIDPRNGTVALYQILDKRGEDTVPWYKRHIPSVTPSDSQRFVGCVILEANTGPLWTAQRLDSLLQQIPIPPPPTRCSTWVCNAIAVLQAQGVLPAETYADSTKVRQRLDARQMQLLNGLIPGGITLF